MRLSKICVSSAVVFVSITLEYHVVISTQILAPLCQQNSIQLGNAVIIVNIFLVIAIFVQ